MAKPHIFLVDNEQDFVFTTSLNLEKLGYQVSRYFDGFTALEATKRQQPVAMLLDLGMETVDGLEVCRRLREQSWGQHLVVIALTGFKQYQQEALEAGFDAYLIKPVAVEQVAESLAYWIAKRQES